MILLIIIYVFIINFCFIVCRFYYLNCIVLLKVLFNIPLFLKGNLVGRLMPRFYHLEFV